MLRKSPLRLESIVLVRNQLCSLQSFPLPDSSFMNTSLSRITPHRVFQKMYSSSSIRAQPVSATSHKKEHLITIKQGRLKGNAANLYDGTPYFSFKGIPYAQPPTGNLRFKAPLPLKSWSGVHDGTEHGPTCPQLDFTTGQILDGDENCLYLNVYSQSLSGSKPVMVYIHGGAFMSGCGNADLYGPEYLLQHDVVLVTINYRLEVLGFLCLDTPDVPGNAGMKDQVAALKWVQENIDKFGGDPNNVTLFGESAGGASVTYHMLSPMSKGLFHKAITQSGVFLNDWTQGVDGKERAFRAGKVLGKEAKSTGELLNYLQKLPALDLVKLTFKTMTYDEKHRGLPIHFAPVVEKRFDNVEAFLSEDPMKLLLEKKVSDVPLMIGYNSAEGILSMANTTRKIDFVNSHMEFKVPREIALKVPEDVVKKFGERVKEFYYDGKTIAIEDREKITTMESDLHFTYGIHRFIHFCLKQFRSPVFMYHFNYESDMNFMKNVTGALDLKGASHADDLFYLFSNVMTKDIYCEQEKVRQMVYVMTKLWTDFAKTGNPTPDLSLGVQWSPCKQDMAYLRLEDPPTMTSQADRARVHFWNKIYCESGLPYITKSNL